MVRLLVDMNLSTEWIPLLRTAGHQAVHRSEVGDPRAPDTASMQLATANGYAVFSHDLDFDTMLVP
jgi:predicted nuclease of predicted toxin-antitoxin system